MLQILIAVGALMGAAGVMLAAAGAHSKPGLGLDSAGHMLLFHASAVIGVALAYHSSLLAPRIGLAALLGLAVGASLFAGDIALRAYTGLRLFPMAAPTGGVILIASWLALAVAALLALAKS